MNERFKIEFTEDEDSYDCRSIMKVIVDGETIREEMDGGEPEDRYFFRDWAWVPTAIKEAYEIGFKHGKESE